MDHQRVKFIFQGNQVKDPIIYQLGHNFHIVTNIRRAVVQEDMGWVILELDGEKEEIERGLQWVSYTGGRADPLSGVVVEG